MRVKIYYLKNPLLCFFILVNFFIGLYIAAVRLKYPESYCFDDLYFYARDGALSDFQLDEFNAQLLMSVFDIMISIPFVCFGFSKNYKTKYCCLTVRYKKYSRFFINEMLNIAAVCLLLSLSYSLGICAFSAFISNFRFANALFILRYLLSVINFAAILLAFSSASLIFSAINNKAAALISIIVFLCCSVLIFFLPDNLKTLDIVMLYFINAATNSGEYLLSDFSAGYIITAVAVISACFFGNKMLQRKIA